jgi:hypothetical protein
VKSRQGLQMGTLVYRTSISRIRVQNCLRARKTRKSISAPQVWSRKRSPSRRPCQPPPPARSISLGVAIFSVVGAGLAPPGRSVLPQSVAKPLLSHARYPFSTRSLTSKYAAAISERSAASSTSVPGVNFTCRIRFPLPCNNRFGSASAAP